ncbi:MAG: DUF1559 domain-containing protein [Planctomycetota bacterium]|nr:DUF1559 domain-containing protein [Planctomycetota bacterium]
MRLIPCRPRRRGVTSTDVLVCLAILLLGSSFTFAQISRAREAANRIKCASNLKQIGLAMLLYSNENRGAYPRGRSDLGKNAEPKPVWGTPYGGAALVPPDEPDFAAKPFVVDEPKDEKDKPLVKYRPEFNDVTAALFQLLRTQDITSEIFVCPSTGLEPWDFGGGKRSALHWTNWAGADGLRKHLSYSYQNPYPSAKAIGDGFKLNNAISAEFAIAGDMNPGGEALLKLNPRSAARQMRDGNSYNHDREGQNILYGDGHVEFLQNPFVGVQRDNVYTFGKSGNDVPDKGGDGFVGSPIGPNDSILLPTARDIAQVDEQGKFVALPKWTAPTAQEAVALREKIVGEYEQTHPDGTLVTLKVSNDQMVAVAGPIMITFGYAIDGLNGPEAQLALTAPQTKGETARIRVADNGDLAVTKNMYYEGLWKRKK